MKKRLNIIAIMLMVVLLSVVLVACGVDVDNHNIKGATNVTINLDKEYAGLEVYSASADINVVNTTEYKITKDDANVFDVVIKCDDYDTQYITFSSLELTDAVVVNVVMEATTYVVEVKVSGIEDEDIENVVISADENIVDYEYNTDDKKFIVTSKVQYSSILVECEGYISIPVEISYFYNVAKVNLSALSDDLGLAIVNIINNADDLVNIKYAPMGSSNDTSDVYLYPGQSVNVIIEINDYVFSDNYFRVISQFVYRSDLEDGYEKVVLEDNKEQRFIFNLLGDDVMNLSIDSIYKGKIHIEDENSIDQSYYVLYEDLSVGDVLLVSIQNNNNYDFFNFNYVVTEEDIANGTLAITNEKVDLTPSSNLTITYVDQDGNAITDDKLLAGLGMRIFSYDGEEDIDPAKGVIQYVNEESHMRFDFIEKYNEYYFINNTNLTELINNNMEVGSTIVEIVLEEIFKINVTFVYYDLDGVLQTYDEGLVYNAINNITDDTNLGFGAGLFLDENTYSYNLIEIYGSSPINLTGDFISDHLNNRDITLPSSVDGMKYDEASDTYLLEILVQKYYDVKVDFKFVGVQVYKGKLVNSSDGFSFDMSSVGDSATIRVTNDFFNNPIALEYDVSNMGSQENVGFLYVTTEMYKQQLIDGNAVVMDINIKENSGDDGNDDF